MQLNDKAIVISGVGSGLGTAITEAVVDGGGQAVIAARTPDVLQTVAKQVDPSGERVAWQRADITVADDRAGLVDAALERFGRIDGIVHCAALDATFGGVEDADFDEWRRVFEVNVFGTMQLTQLAVPALKQTGGSIVFVGTQAVYKCQVMQMAYAASKAALQGAAVHLATELGAHGIRVNTVVPSWIWGPAVQGYLEGLAAERGVELDVVIGEITQGMSIKQIPTSRDIADSVAYFLSDESRRVTGQSLLVNAGEYLR